MKFHQGDVITTFGEMDDDGYYLGELKGVRGMARANFLGVPNDTKKNESVHKSEPQKIVFVTDATTNCPKAFQTTPSEKPPLEKMFDFFNLDCLRKAAKHNAKKHFLT